MGMLIMKNISELQAFSYDQIVSAVQIFRVMEKHGLNKDDLVSIKKGMEKQMLLSGPKRKNKP